jgi:hypothetical protein
VNRAWLALGLTIVFPGVMAWIYFDAVSPKGGAESPNPALQIIYAGTKVIQFSFPLILGSDYVARRRASGSGSDSAF